MRARALGSTSQPCSYSTVTFYVTMNTAHFSDVVRAPLVLVGAIGKADVLRSVRHGASGRFWLCGLWVVWVVGGSCDPLL